MKDYLGVFVLTLMFSVFLFALGVFSYYLYNALLAMSGDMGVVVLFSVLCVLGSFGLAWKLIE